MSSIKDINKAYGVNTVVDTEALDKHIAEMTMDVKDSTEVTGTMGQFITALANTKVTRDRIADILEMSHSNIQDQYSEAIADLSIRNTAILKPKEYMENELKSLVQIDDKVAKAFITELGSLLKSKVHRKKAKELAEKHATRTLEHMYEVHQLAFPSKYTEIVVDIQDRKNKALRKMKLEGGGETSDMYKQAQDV